MSWEKGDRLKITLEVTATEPFDEDLNDIWFATSHGRAWIEADDIFAAGGTVSVEVISENVDVLDGQDVPCSRPLASQLRAECSQSSEGCPGATLGHCEAKVQSQVVRGEMSDLNAKCETSQRHEQTFQLNFSGTSLDSPSVVVSVLVTPETYKATVGVPAGLSGSPSGESAGSSSCEVCSHERA